MGQVAAKLNEKSEKHPLVARLTDGLCVYSQSFWGDFWLCYKNQHIVTSIWTAHPEHYFSRNERFWVALASIFVAFGLSGMTAEIAQVTCANATNLTAMNQSQTTLNATQTPNQCPVAGHESDITTLINLSILSCVIQVLYDQFSALMVTCGCLQTGCPEGLKICCEVLGKCGFCFLFLLAIVFLTLGALFAEQDVAATFMMFIISKLFTFFVSGSATLLVMFYIGRSGQASDIPALICDHSPTDIHLL
jgi:hypothetical protein